MSNPWISIPLADYEGHMDAVQQLGALSELFGRALAICRPDSVAVLGIAGGNGLEHVDRAAITRIVGVDINAEYLDEVRRRFGAHADLELHCVDLSQEPLRVAPVALVHAALFFEHAGLGPTLDHALSLVSPGGRFSVVLQLPATDHGGVSPTPFPSMQRLAANFSYIDIAQFRGLLEQRGLRLLTEELRPLSTGKALWLGVFSTSIAPRPGA
jgi:threonine dehydrogenase-like Zn-dependent dehydrogenase